MSKQHVLIFRLPELFNILNELKNHLDFNTYSLIDEKKLNETKKNFLGNYLVVTDEKNQIKGEKFQLTLDNFPDSLETIIEKINVNLLKQKYFEQSEIVVGNYKLDFNSRSIRVGELKLKLTEREIEVIIFLNNSKKPATIETLQKEVWGHNLDLETHTVETHIYRLRKKIIDKFKDNNFIISTKVGYKIK